VFVDDVGIVVLPDRIQHEKTHTHSRLSLSLAHRSLTLSRVSTPSHSHSCAPYTQKQVREQFGKKLAVFQNTQFVVADMGEQLLAARLMVREAASALDRNDPLRTVRCAMAKRFATDRCHALCDQSLQLFGGYGYLRDYPVQRYLRDLRVHRILEGTNEIMRLIASRHLL
jgi:alkylation response protein AidB-like acyl-CoA dehydrogenase